MRQISNSLPLRTMRQQNAHAPRWPRRAPRSRPRTAALSLVTGVLALTLAACGSSAVREPGVSLNFTIPATSAPPGVTTVQSPPQAADHAALPPCTPHDLHFTISRVTDTLGQVNFTLHVTNLDQFDCFLEGYPTVTALVGGALARSDMASDVREVPSPPAVVLRPALSATADLHLSDDAAATRCRRHVLNAVKARIGSASLGQVEMHGPYWVCEPSVPGQLGIAAWAPVIHSDLDENDG